MKCGEKVSFDQMMNYPQIQLKAVMLLPNPIIHRFKWLIGLLLVTLISCSSEHDIQEATYREIIGKTMGTTYSVKYKDPQQEDYQPAIDSLLVAINDEVSTYIQTSTISKFNQSEQGISLDTTIHSHFLANWKLAKSVFAASNGMFDPTIMPLVNFWGFGYEGRKKVEEVNPQTIDSLLGFVGMNRVQLMSKNDQISLIKEIPGIQLDFSACAKGYAVDQVASLLHRKGINDYLVEIGREVKAHGVNDKGKVWNIGISMPEDNAPPNAIHSVTALENKSLATSGNYQNFYEVDGKKYAHTINPTTGYSELNQLLSASVYAKSCGLADGYATAFMVMGIEDAFQLASAIDDVEAYFIYSDQSGSYQVRYTDGLSELFDK